ncbi:hypothetical protein A3SI_04427 [Nitritalea halalkaliphila LW7]|uniref:DUF3253 domain-containing protein n=1 Tax=Nitritalea halalkaliphila LW7 TaxID=1189621 RepID=I5C890_9BACT|nr:DUF3253 domain-containing protein [Nitritalea halalkaliphila]EIM78042.1 hypothetical protein A3SI_04427 [Nitritalea halalkaliphila LW7]
MSTKAGINARIVHEAIVFLAEKRGRDASFCPSEVARWLFPQDWRHFMDVVREAAFELYREDVVRILQAGELVPKDEPVKGPIRIAKR